MNAPLIRTRDLAKKFGLLCAVQGVTLQIDVPGIVAIVGPNGAGKTTLMRMLVGGINPSGGYAEIVGCDVCERGPLLASKIGYLPERLALYEELRVEESLIYFANLRGYVGDEAETRVSAVLDQLGLSGFRTRIVGSLSKGYRQRLGLGQALLHEPKVLILDEPFSGFDPLQRVDIAQLLVKLAKDRLIVFSTHVLSDVQRLADRVIILSNGQIVADGNIQEMAEQVGFRAWYELALQDLDEGAQKILEGLPSVEQVRLSGEQRFEIVADGTFLAELAEVVAREGWVVSHLSDSQVSLEDVFIALTSGDV